MHRPRIRRGALGRVLPLLVGAVALLGLGCGMKMPSMPKIPFIGGDDDSGDAHAVRDQARPLAIGEWHRDALHCAEGDCRDWYQLEVDQHGQLEIDVYAPAERGDPTFNLVLENDLGEVLVTAASTGRSPRQISKRVSPGTYRVLLDSLSSTDAALGYDIRTELRPRSAASRPPAQEPRRAPPRPAARPAPTPKPPPAASTSESALPAEVLDFEAGDPAFVLIDAGSPQGVTRGVKGRLIQNERTIATIVVVDVYEAGSRARITSDLDVEIKPLDTTVEIQLPKAGR